MGSICSSQGVITLASTSKARECMSHKLELGSPIFSEPSDNFYMDYQLHVESLDIGVYSEVSLCTKISNKKQRVVKIVSKSCLPVVLIEQKLIHRVVERLKRMNNYNGIAKYSRAYENKDSFYIVYEYFDEGSLNEWVESVKITEEAVERVMKQVIDTVMWLEEIGFYQYELKPENIFISDPKTLTTKVNLFTLRCLLNDKYWLRSYTQKPIQDIKAELFHLTLSMLPNISDLSTNSHLSSSFQHFLTLLSPSTPSSLIDIQQHLSSQLKLQT